MKTNECYGAYGAYGYFPKKTQDDFLILPKTQKHPFPKTPVRPRGYQLPPKQDIKPKTIEIAEPKKAETKADILEIPFEDVDVQNINKLISVKSERMQPESLQQAKSIGEFSELFTQDNILRGMILKEVLLPPKAIRKRYD